jgi:hypothetical protein
MMYAQNAPAAEAEPKEPNPDLGQSLPGASRQESDTGEETAALREIIDEAQQHGTD